MNGRPGGGWRFKRLLVVVLLVTSAVAGGCGPGSGTATSGSTGKPTAAAAAGQAAAAPRTVVTPPGLAPNKPNLPSTGVIAALEGRMAAMNRGDGEAAASFYAPDGVMYESDTEGWTTGQEALAQHLNDLYRMGLRLAPAGAPIAWDRYVAEPARFYNSNGPGRGAGMLVFEVGDDGRFAHQWAIGWAGGPEKTFGVLTRPVLDEPNLPPRRVAMILERWRAAMNRGDARAAAALFGTKGDVTDLTRPPGSTTRGRSSIERLLAGRYEQGLRLRPAGAPIAYDQYVAVPLEYVNPEGMGTGAGMFVFSFAPTYKIAHQWVIGWLGE
jgi:hypothetical protein